MVNTAVFLLEQGSGAELSSAASYSAMGVSRSSVVITRAGCWRKRLGPCACSAFSAAYHAVANRVADAAAEPRVFPPNGVVYRAGTFSKKFRCIGKRRPVSLRVLIS